LQGKKEIVNSANSNFAKSNFDSKNKTESKINHKNKEKKDKSKSDNLNNTNHTNNLTITNLNNPNSEIHTTNTMTIQNSTVQTINNFNSPFNDNSSYQNSSITNTKNKMQNREKYNLKFRMTNHNYNSNLAKQNVLNNNIFTENCNEIYKTNQTLESYIKSNVKKFDKKKIREASNKKNEENPERKVLKFDKIRKEIKDAVPSQIAGVTTYIDKTRADLIKFSDYYSRINENLYFKLKPALQDKYKKVAQAAEIPEYMESEVLPFNIERLEKNNFKMKKQFQSIYNIHKRVLEKFNHN
jgi:hypothetical protein